MLGAAMACIAPIMKEYLPLMIGLRGGPRSNWVHAEDVARATAHLMEHGRPGEAYNVCDDDAIPFGDIIPMSAEAYGLKSFFHIPYPPLGIMSKLVPVLQRSQSTFTSINRVFSGAWEKICAKHDLERALSPKLDPEAMEYGYRHTIFVNEKLKATGFELKYPSIRDGWPPTIRWYQRHRWVPAY
jgi:nucleoside-diphosphate-sugar epimerase